MFLPLLEKINLLNCLAQGVGYPPYTLYKATLYPILSSGFFIVPESNPGHSMVRNHSVITYPSLFYN